MVFNKENGKPTGFAFVEYENERDMKEAWERADGSKIEGKRIVVDVERGRTVKSWLPRRLGTRSARCAVSLLACGGEGGVEGCCCLLSGAAGPLRARDAAHAPWPPHRAVPKVPPLALACA